MTTVSPEEPHFQAAIEACTVALRRIAAYEFNPTLHEIMHELGERKEYLTQAEHDELLGEQAD